MKVGKRLCFRPLLVMEIRRLDRLRAHKAAGNYHPR
jgi:hypothetical protein